MAAQKQKLIQALSQAVAEMDNETALRRVLGPLGYLHAHAGVASDQYKTVGSALIQTLEAGLGDAWTENARTAWTETYRFISDCMIEGAETALRA